jgi:hypothetical protein
MGVDVVLHLFDIGKYERVLLPAYRAFLDSSDRRRLIELFDELLPTIESRHDKFGLISHSADVYQEFRGILSGELPYSSTGESGPALRETSPQDLRIFIDGQVLPVLLRLVCVPQTTGFYPEQNMSERPLMSHLYEHSRWIDEYFTFGREPTGPTPEIKLAEWGRLFSKDEVRQFDAELSNMPRPVDGEELIADFDNLRALVRAVDQEPTLDLLLSIG